MSAAAPAAVRQAAAKATLTLPFAIPAKDHLTIAEAATACGMGSTFIEEKFDKAEAEGRGDLAGHKHNAGQGKRHSKRIPRIFVVAYMIKTATYTDESLLDCLIGCIRHLPRESLLRLADAARRFAGEKPPNS
jgi:hypothetical protein